MRKPWIIVVNVLLTLSIMVLVVSHTNHEKQQQIAARIEAFESMTVAVEKVAVNYLEGEQQVCDVWAKYINNSDMTMEEAADFIRKSHVTTTSSAHLLYTDDGSYQGLSTRAHQDDPDDYTVSYRKIWLRSRSSLPLRWIPKRLARSPLLAATAILRHSKRCSTSSRNTTPTWN